VKPSIDASRPLEFELRTVAILNGQARWTSGLSANDTTHISLYVLGQDDPHCRTWLLDFPAPAFRDQGVVCAKDDPIAKSGNRS